MQTLLIDRIVGQTLGNYRVERLMGQGRLSAVYLAQSVLTGMNGALTLFIIPERFSNDAYNRFMQRFRKEAGALTALQHLHLLPVHEYGEHQRYPYLVTPYMTNGSLADILKRQGRCDHTYVLDILEQVVEGLEYAHRKGVIHGTLKPSNIVLSPDQDVLVAGFGLMHILQMRGIERDDRPYGHLLSIADTFLAAPEYIAPEVVQGQSIDKRSDIYALGIILFELLSGKPPFTGTNAMEVAKMHVQQSVPSLRALCPDIPGALASVINQALDRDPARRFQSASELAEAFAQASIGASGSMRRLDKAPETSPLATDSALEPQTGSYSASNWQFMPPIVTGKLKAVNAPAKAANTTPSTQPAEDSWQFMPPIVTGRLEAVNAPAKTALVAPKGPQKPAQSAPSVKVRPPAPPTLVPPAPEPVVYVDPARVPQLGPIEQGRDEWWQPASQESLVLRNLEADSWNAAPAATPARTRPASAGRARPALRRSRKAGMDRRKVIALLAAGGVVAAGALIGVKMNLGPHVTGTTATNQRPAANNGNAKNTPAPQQNKQQGGNGNQKTQNPPAAPQTGPSIASTNMALNSSVVFNGGKDLLIRLPNGNFVAYDRACTHEGVPVNYHPETKTIICPAHGAVFNPANGAVLGGPAPSPIAPVKIHVNGNGTITMV
jgi:serine/threonine protein kinase/Rieske Fe-S protein